jgi:ATP-binding cassette subfamily B protein
MENIAYGNQRANKKEVINASKNAEIHDFITSLSEGYNTIIDPENLNFSVGQCQRIALARAFVKDSSILILDEALSHIEKTKVKRIENFLLKKTKKKTVIIITHHLSNKLAYSVNKILYFENGKIVERKKGLCCVNQNQE